MLRSTYLFFLLFFLGALSPLIGQGGIPDKIGSNTDRGPSLNAMKKKADSGTERGDYSVAMHYYHLLWRRDSTNADALAAYAEAALANTQYDTAVWAFQTLLNRNLTKDAGHTMVRLAYTYYCAGNYDEAERRYRQVETVAGVSQKSKDEAADGLENCAWAKGIMGENQIQFSDRISQLNTRRAEYAPVRVDNTIYYTSYSKPLNRDTTRSRMHILAATPDGDSMRVTSSDLNDDNKHTAYLAFNESRTVQYFARAEHEKESALQFHLYRRKSAGDGVWGPVEKLPGFINLKDYTATQPNLGRLPGDTVETLFFVSDRPGGEGKKDIWYCRIANDTFSTPQNLKAVNTKGDDVSPFYFSGDSTLYFSSTAYPQMNLGGFDIFRAKKTATGWSAPAPMPPPFNSGANDVFFSMTEACQMRFWASNREGSANYSEEECCYNLYGTGQKLEIKIDVFHKETRAPLAETEMRLMEKTASGWVETNRAAVPGYTQVFPLTANKEYQLITSKPGFSSDTLAFNSRDDGWGICLDQKCYLRPIKIDLNVYVFDAETKQPFPGADIFFYDVAARRPDGSMQTGPAGGVLDSAVLLNHPDHFRHFDLKPDHDYRMRATKLGYTDDSAVASTMGFTRDTTLRRDLYIQQGLQYTVRVFDEFTKEPLDSASFTLKESRIDFSNEKTYTYTSGTGSNEYNRTIFYDRRYNISVTREGYRGDNASSKGRRTDAEGLVKVPFQHIYDTLYLRRITLPIVLYYDNDVPDQGTLNTDTSTSWLYAGTYVSYTDRWKKNYNGIGYFQRKDRYLKECCSGMSETDPRYIEMKTFFDSLVQGEWLRLRAFREYLTEKLRNGECVKVNIAGFASPLGNAAYNKKLTRRRVDCLLNHLQKFEGETDIAEFYKQGRFVIEADYNGSDDAIKNGVPGKGKASVYSVSAAKARKVMIVSMETFKCDNTVSGSPSGSKK